MAARTRKTATKSAPAPAVSNSELGDFLDALIVFIKNYRADNVDAPAEADTEPDEAQQTPVAKTRGRKAKPAPEPEPEDEDEDDDDDEAAGGPGKSEAELKKMRLPALKKLAKEYFDDDAVDGASKDDLIESLLSLDADDDDDDEDLDDDEDDTDDDDAEDDEDGDDDERAELEALNIGALRKKARDEYEATAAELKGLDKEGIIDLILNTEGEDDADSDVDADDEEEGYTQDELEEMTLDELKEIADEWEITYTARVKEAKLISLILEEQEAEEE